MTFRRVPIQEFEPDQPFSVVSSVTVIAHNPFEEQPALIRKLRDLTEPGGHAIILENAADQAAHVFSNSPAGWERLFADAGFELVTSRAYDYSPAIRLVAGMRRMASRALPGRRNGGRQYVDPTADRDLPGGIVRRLDTLVQLGAVKVDHRIEPQLLRRQVNVPSVHRGFLFRAV
jgi:hypothetical protein